MKVTVRPFRVASHGRVSAVSWSRLSGPSEVPLPDFLRDWDPVTDVHVGVRARLDARGLEEDTGLEHVDDVRFVLAWKSRSTSFAGAATSASIDLMSDHVELAVDAIVPGKDAGGVLELEALLVLGSGRSSGGFAAHREGSILWRDERTLGLEGDQSRFPVEIVDFGTVPGLSKSAAWFLDWDSGDLAAPVMGGIRLQVNAANPALSAALRTGVTGPDARAIRDFLRYDTARSMVHGALQNTEFSLNDEYENASVGAALQALIRAALPNQSLATLRITQRQNPSEIDAELQAFVALFRLSAAST